MKTTLIILAIVATATAQSRRASLTLTSGVATSTGEVEFTQARRNSPIQITGNLTGLQPGAYYYGSVHRKQDVLNRCANLGPIALNSNGALFHIFTIFVNVDGEQRWKMSSDRLTLVSGGQDSIISRAVGIHDRSDLDPPIACGWV